MVTEEDIDIRRINYLQDVDWGVFREPTSLESRGIGLRGAGLHVTCLLIVSCGQLPERERASDTSGDVGLRKTGGEPQLLRFAGVADMGFSV